MFGGRFGRGFTFDGRQVSEKLLEVALVIAQSMRTNIALVAQMVEELSEKLIDQSK